MLNDDDLSDDDEGNVLERLFICEDYRPISMEIKGISTTTHNEIMAETILPQFLNNKDDGDDDNNKINPKNFIKEAISEFCKNQLIKKEQIENDFNVSIDIENRSISPKINFENTIPQTIDFSDPNTPKLKIDFSVLNGTVLKISLLSIDNFFILKVL
jgi:hypothetical protein